MRRRLAAGLLVAAAAPLVALALSAGSPAQADSKQVSAVSEAWFLLSSDLTTLGLDAGSTPDAVSTFPAGTLHVAAALGRTAAAAFITPDLTDVPAGSSDVTATLTLPVDADPAARNVGVATANIVGCPATASVPDEVFGDLALTSPIPTWDCSVASSPATYDATKNAFTLDLTPLLADWQPGALAPAVALVVGDGGSMTTAWHVAIDGRDSAAATRTSVDASWAVPAPAPSSTPTPTATPTATATATPTSRATKKATATASASATATSDPVGPVVSVAPVTVPDPVAAPTVPATTPEATTATPTVAPTDATLAEPAATAEPIQLVNGAWWSYRGMVFLPLLFLVGVGLAGRALTQQVTPRKK